MKYLYIRQTTRSVLAGLAMIATLTGCSEDKKDASGGGGGSAAAAKTAIQNKVKEQAKASGNAAAAVLPAAVGKDPSSAASSTDLYAEDTAKFFRILGSMEPSTDITEIKLSYIGFYKDNMNQNFVRTYTQCEFLGASEGSPKSLVVMTSIPMAIDLEDYSLNLNKEKATTEVVYSSSEELQSMTAVCAQVGNSFILESNEYAFDLSESSLTLSSISHSDLSPLTYSQVSFE